MASVSPTLLSWYNNKTAQPVEQNGAGMIDHVKNYVVDTPQTTQGQLNNIIKQDSPLMQQARAQGIATANERGLLNSSVAAGAAQDAMIQNALPIAQSDAEKYNRAAGYNVDEYNKAVTANAQNQYATNERVGAQNYNTGLEQLKNTNEVNKNLTNLVAGMTNDYTKMVAEINKDPNMNQTAKDYAIRQIYESARTNITLMSNVGKVPNVSTLLAPMAPVAKPAATYYNSQQVNAQMAAAQQAAAAAGKPSGGKMICARCWQLGLMDDDTYLADQLYGALQDAGFMRWYWSWASPLVKKMHGETLLSRLFIWLVWQWVKPWSRQMAFEMGVASKGSVLGALMMKTARLAYRLSTSHSENRVAYD